MSSSVLIIYVFFVIVFTSLFLLGNAGWVDPDSLPEDMYTSSYHDGSTYDLVMSDEFEVDGRRFDDGHDPRWTAIHKDDYTNNALQYYNRNLVKTKHGKLVINTIMEDVSFKAEDKESGKLKTMTKNYQSAMVQGWNKFCFTGGIVEMRARLPGSHKIGGLWPAMWLLGNLARATYVGSSDNVWPWSYNQCKQKLQFGQEISACNSVNHYDMHAFMGRGAPEIDLLEAMPGVEILKKTNIKKPYFSSSLQVSPGLLEFRPEVGDIPMKGKWYEKDLEYGKEMNTSLNIFFYGVKLDNLKDKRKAYQADAVSANTNIGQTHFDDFHTYRLEWTPGQHGHLKWYLDGIFLYSIGKNALNITGAQIPEEPMYLLLNTAMSKTWGFPQPCPEGCACDCYDCRDEKCSCALPTNMCDNFPAEFEIDWVRLYQKVNDSSQTIGCSTTDYPTSRYIKGHKKLFMGEHDTEPLQPQIVGGALCEAHIDCGKGKCITGICECEKNWVGPNCLASLGWNDIDWEPEEPIVIDSIFIPTTLRIWAVVFLLLIFAVVGYKYYSEKKEHEYSEIPEIEVL